MSQEICRAIYRSPHHSSFRTWCWEYVTKSRTRLFYTFQNPAYSMVLKENVWGEALNRVLVDGSSSEEAADEAIARIKQIFAQWQ